jgi:septum formation protein
VAAPPHAGSPAGDDPLVLASRSPQRRAILEQLGVDFRVVAPDAEEETSGEPRAMVVENALRKARSVEGAVVLGVDTTVVLDGRSFGKPADEAEAETVLRRLSGRTHEVWSGIAVRREGSERTSACVTKVRFRRLEQRELAWYLGSGEWRDRAGGYAIQGRGAALVEAVEGDFWNVVGLPVRELLRLEPDLARSRS